MMHASLRDGWCVRSRRFGKWVLVGAFLASLDLNSTAELNLPRPDPPPPDHRAARLEAFFKLYHCPEPFHIDEYLLAADTNAIDYRLLPALSVRESTCGLHARLNNRWGWDSARTGFASVAEGIRYVARQLGSGRFYRGKPLDDKLRIYNPNPQYAGEIRDLMRQIEDDTGL